jgi:hypothetical protein
MFRFKRTAITKRGRFEDETRRSKRRAHASEEEVVARLWRAAEQLARAVRVALSCVSRVMSE